MKTIHLVCAIAAMLLWSACKKKNNDEVLPASVPVDTLALLTGCEWLFTANGKDLNNDGEIDIGGITLVYSSDVYTYFHNGILVDTVYNAGAPIYNGHWTWKFVYGKAIVDLFTNDTTLVEEFRIMKISDSNLVTLQIANPQFGWRIYTKYTR